MAENIDAKRMAEGIQDALRDRSGTEYLEEIDKQVKVISGLLVIYDPISMSVSTMKADAPWSITCGMGFYVTFGNSIFSEATNGPLNAVKLTLSLGKIDQSKCEQLSLLVGQEIKRIVSTR